MALSSPGVETKLINESFYTPAEPGTVPLIIVASADNKQNGSGTGIAAGTLKSNANKLYLISSQRDLVDTFGDPSFKLDGASNPIHAGELNEYGLQAAYSFLGVSNRAYILRADVDLNSLSPSSSEPTSNPDNGTYWVDTAASAYGIFEWDNDLETFSLKTPSSITDQAKIDNLLGGPISSIGSIGDYAMVFKQDWDIPEFNESLWYKSGTATWVNVGSEAWAASWPVLTGTANVTSSTAIDSGESIVINGEIFAYNSPTLDTVGELITAINANVTLSAAGVSAGIVAGKFNLYSTEVNVVIAPDTGDDLPANLGLTAGTYKAPSLAISKHTVVPTFNVDESPTGSVWVKTTQPNAGARWRVRRYNGTTNLWELTEAPIYSDNQSAIADLDLAGGGKNIPIGALYVKSNYDEEVPSLANFKVFRRKAIGSTSIRINSFNPSVLNTGSNLVFTMSQSPTINTLVTITIPSASDADGIATIINAAGLTKIVATVDAQGRLTISHTDGGEIGLKDGANTPLDKLGLAAFNPSNNSGTANLYESAAATFDFIASLWEPLSATASDNAPSEIANDNAVWYDSNISEVDILINTGTKWVGMKHADATALVTNTDPAGPIISASVPVTQSDKTDLVTGDLWIDTSDLENYPTIYRYDAALINKPVKSRWIKIDKADQTTSLGIVFADARYSTTGEGSNVRDSIVDLLASDYCDSDAPDPQLYPAGILLWNLRRSGFNVKQFKQNYVDLTADNPRKGNESQIDYYPHRWVTISANEVDGSGSFGRKSQRSVVVAALQAAINTNQEIRDDEAKLFNLIAVPGYPELISEAVALNVDRKLTAFVVGDSPARLKANSTDLINWGNNQNAATQDGDVGLVTTDEQLGVFYPWGYTSDNFGNNVVVPASHMMLRTIALSDQVSYPWFAPAGVRRGGITNASSVGYVNEQGEFVSIALNEPLRDTLASINVNPITYISGTGLVNFGQKTRARTASAMDRINVARLVAHLRRQLTSLSKPYIFEPNDKITRDEIKGEVESLMLELVSQRAIYDFVVVCDESNNTPLRIDRNELYVDIAVEPVKGIEFIYIPIRLKNTGEISG